MALAPQRALQRRRLAVTGVVQGVGFRPFVHRLAERSGLAGFVLNDSRGVVIEVEGEGEALDAFAAALSAEAPTLARVEAVASAQVEPLGTPGFGVRLGGGVELGDTTHGAASAEIVADVMVLANQL